MSNDDLGVLRAALSCWPEAPEIGPEAALSDYCSRALDAMYGLLFGKSAWGDVASLIRQVLLTARFTYGGHPDVIVPTIAPWPTQAQWRQLDCTAEATQDDRLRIRPRPTVWVPGTFDEYHPELGQVEVEEAYRDRPLRLVPEVTADPFWTHIHGYDNYRGQTQRQAARAAVLAEPGSSLIISLPTGRGKTAVAWSKALLSQKGVTLVVVPTVVLATDMERRTREYCASSGKMLSPLKRYAYVGDLDTDTKSRLREAVRTGNQRILYTSPEALVFGLAHTVIECARSGSLQQVVIDEAHLVDQWGSEFRPEFQTMAGVISEAISVAPPATKPTVLLLSATLAQRHVEMLSDMFSGDAGKPDLIWGTELRAEPAFFKQETINAEEREHVVLQSIAMLPKPLILYITTPSDAEVWCRKICESGITRVSMVTGDSTSQQRQDVVNRWRGTTASDGVRRVTDIDIVVGTSAFGLGIDVDNVRTVIHACLPETIDRFYQEVGRAGRDGQASLSFLATCPSDFSKAQRLNSISLVTKETGWRRWSAMQNSAESVCDHRFRVNLGALPSNLPSHSSESHGRNADWNARTLNLMARAGMIRLAFGPWDSPRDDDRPVSVSMEFEILDGSKMSSHEWGKALDDARNQVHKAQEAALTSMREVVKARRCVGRILADHYAIRHDGGILPVTPLCRSCAWCRRHPDLAVGIGSAEPIPALPEHGPWRDPVAAWRGRSPYLFIWYEDDQTFFDILITLVRRGLNMVSGLPLRLGSQVQKEVVPVPLIVDACDGPSILNATERPGLYLLESGDEFPWNRATAYVLGHRNTLNPRKPSWTLWETIPSISAEALLKEL